MIKEIIPFKGLKRGVEWCDHCKKQCIGPREPFLVTSTNNIKDMVLCKCCIDLALNENNILPEEF